MKEREKITSRGITLIALVVTVVILIILATISINIVLKDNGIIKRAEKGKDIWENSVEREKDELDKLAEEYDNILAGWEQDKPMEMPSTWDKNKVTAIDDGKGNPVPIPKGFYYVGGNIETGIVISDKNGDTMDASGTSMGNQFVWIPVRSPSDLERTEFDESGQPIDSIDDYYTEPCNYNGETGYPTEANEYTTMRTQVLKYKGFYIGRYEAGVNGTTFRTESDVSTVQEVVSKKGVAPYHYVKWGESMSNIGTTGAVYLSQNKYKNHESVTSTLCYGCQWDAMCRYIGDSNRKISEDEKTNSPRLTGSLTTDVSKNIYDLAGNCREWTMEAFDSYIRVDRGGSYNRSVYPVSDRDLTSPGSYYDDYSFRLALYIK